MDSDIPEDIEPEIWNEVKTYFTDKKWRKTTEYLKRRNCRLLENYKLLLSLGFATAPKPFYMLERKKLANDPSSSDDSSKSDAEEDTTSKVKDTVKKRGRPRCRTVKGPAEKVRDRGVSRKTVETKTKELTESNTKVSVKNSSELLHLVVPKHLEGIMEPVYMINLDDHPSDDENDDYEFQGFTDRNFDLSVIRFNFVRHMKSKIENEILSGNSSEGGDKIQDSGVKENEIVNPNLGETNNNVQDNDDGDKDQAEVKKSQICSTEDENKSRYPKRNIPAINYMEERVPDDDEYIYCDACEIEWQDGCPYHGPLTHIPDAILDPKVAKSMQYSEASVPQSLKVAQSSLPDEHAGQGVWSLTTIPGRSVFGPYKGKKVDKNNKSGYCWQISKNRRPLYCIDALNPRYGNWMRFVNCARHRDEQNVVAYQYKGQIYYRTFEDIPPHNELLVFYGDHYAKQLGVSLEDFKKKRTEPLKSRGFQCLHCKTSFSSPIYRDRHESLYCLKNKHTEDTNRRYKCDECGKRFTLKAHLERHKLIHSGVRPHECNVCNKWFTQKSNLDTHISTVHNKDRRYVCDVCNKCFTRIDHLTVHKRIHNKEKPYHCDTCNKKFTELRHLTYHIRVHTGERPYKCNVCNKGFVHSGHLTTHIRIHTGERPYSCIYCDMRFISTSHRNCHVKNKHNNMSV